MGRCALVMADWSTNPKFAQKIAMKPAAGRSLAVLMRSVATTTRVSQFSESSHSSTCIIFVYSSNWVQLTHTFVRPILAEGNGIAAVALPNTPPAVLTVTLADSTWSLCPSLTQLYESETDTRCRLI